MGMKEILGSIDSEIARLQNVRDLLAETTKADSATPKRRKLSTAARKKIAAAQRKRWAKQKAGK